MARGELIGLCECPECGFADAEVRPDKSGAPYRFCPDCTAQYFSRGVPHKVKNLMAQLNKHASAVWHIEIPAPELKPDTPPAPAAPALIPARKKFDMADI